MTSQTVEQLRSKGCAACEGGVEKYSPQQAGEQLQTLAGWKLTHDGTRIRKDLRAKNFVAAMDFLVQVSRLAEQQRHHPDLHLESYRCVWIEIHTHAIGGLSENDFILAAKIDQLPIG